MGSVFGRKGAKTTLIEKQPSTLTGASGGVGDLAQNDRMVTGGVHVEPGAVEGRETSGDLGRTRGTIIPVKTGEIMALTGKMGRERLLLRA